MALSTQLLFFFQVPAGTWLMPLFPGPLKKQDRPCTRCIKRNIGHLCHDEPRENVKRAKSEHEASAPEEEVSSSNDFAGAQNMPRKIEPHEINQVLRNSSVPNLSTSIDHSQSSQPQGISSNPVDVNPQQRE